MTQRDAVRLGALRLPHRARIESLLRASARFRDDEIAVALELFDDGCAAGGIDEVRSDDYRFIGAFDARQELIGYACWGPTPGTDRAFDLYWIVVDPSAQGGGVGSALMAEVERRLAGEGARLLVVETSSRAEYAAARGFYEARAYMEVARVREFYAPGDARVVFTKRLDPSPRGGGALFR